MDCKAVYDNLMQKARSRGGVAGYSEKHHVVPRCLGGGNSKDNLVVLTAEEHFLAHQLRDPSKYAAFGFHWNYA